MIKLLLFLFPCISLSQKSVPYDEFQPIAEAFKNGHYYRSAEIASDSPFYYSAALDFQSNTKIIHFLNFDNFFENLMTLTLEMPLRVIYFYLFALKNELPNLISILKSKKSFFDDSNLNNEVLPILINSPKAVKEKVSGELCQKVGPLVVLAAAGEQLDPILFPNIYMVEKGYNRFYIEEYKEAPSSVLKYDYISFPLASLKERLTYYQSLIDAFADNDHKESIITCKSEPVEIKAQNPTQVVLKNKDNKAFLFNTPCADFLFQIMPFKPSNKRQDLLSKVKKGEEIVEDDLESLEEGIPGIRVLAKLILIIETNGPVGLFGVGAKAFPFDSESYSIQELATAVFKRNLKIYYPAKEPVHNSFLVYREFITVLAKALLDLEEYSSNIILFSQKFAELIEFASIVEAIKVSFSAREEKRSDLEKKGFRINHTSQDQFKIDTDVSERLI